MELKPKFSYEFNCMLNENFNETDQIQNFASIISDKDRFLELLNFFDLNKKLIEEKLDYKLLGVLEFYIVRAEKFKSFSEPITIEYSLLPEEMFLFLFKEILKVSIIDRFMDDILREQYLNSFIEYVILNGKFDEKNFEKYFKNLHDESLRLFKGYKKIEIDFEKKSMKQFLEEQFS